MMRKPSILIVDDQSGVRRLLYEIFIDEGYDVRMAEGGKIALAMISQELPDIFLLDVKMPIMNGIDTLRELRKAYPGLCVIMMTACGELEVLEEAKSLGVDHYIVKPFDIQEIRLLVKTLVRAFEHGDQELKFIG